MGWICAATSPSYLPTYRQRAIACTTDTLLVSVPADEFASSCAKDAMHVVDISYRILRTKIVRIDSKKNTFSPCWTNASQALAKKRVTPHRRLPGVVAASTTVPAGPSTAVRCFSLILVESDSAVPEVASAGKPRSSRVIEVRLTSNICDCRRN